MDGRGGTREVINLINLHVEWKRHIVAHQFKSRVRHQVFDIAAASREEVVDAQDIMSLRNQAIAQMTAEKARSTCNENTFDGAILAHGLFRVIGGGACRIGGDDNSCWEMGSSGRSQSGNGFGQSDWDPLAVAFT